MACALTQDYNQAACAELFGGVKEVHFIEFANMLTAPVTAGAVTAATKVASMFFRKYNLKEFTGEPDEVLTTNRMNNTQSVKQTLKFPLQGLSTSLRNEILLLAKNRLVAVVVGEDGVGWMFGKEKGLKLSTAGAKMGKGLNDFNGYELTLEGEEKDFAPSLTSVVVATLQTPGA